MKQKRNRRQFHILLAVSMAILILGLDLWFWLQPDRVFSETENRNLQQFPLLTWNTATTGRFESLFDQYIADQFPGRDTWIKTEAAITRLAGNTMSHDIFLGKQGYLIQKFEEPSKEAYEKLLKDITDLAKYAETASETGTISVFALIAPTAVSIHKALLPANAYPVISGDEDAFLDRLFQDLHSRGIHTIDIRPDLCSLRDSGTQVYYRTDHHWTTDAAFAAWQAFADAAQIQSTDASSDITSESYYDRLAVTASFQGTLSASSGYRTSQTDTIYVYLPDESGTEPVRYIMINRDTGEKRASLYDPSFLETRDQYALFLGGNHGEVKIQTSTDTDRNILVIKDSYANCFIPFLLPAYQNILVIDPRYYLGSIEQLITEENITDILFLYNAETL